MRPLLAALLALVLAGCAGYTLGPTNGAPAGSRSVQVVPFINTTTEPRISAYLSSSIRKQLQHDGTFRLQTQGAPDFQVTGEIIRFNRSPISYTTNDVLTPHEYRITLTARVQVRDLATGKTNFNHSVQGQTFLRAGDDLPSSEREAMPMLADDLAHNIVSLLVDGTW
jgi:outer membrane lipopolysaccharide assembly protein LptE/RlpB